MDLNRYRKLLQLEMDARHAKVLEPHSRGMTQVEIARVSSGKRRK